MSTCSTLLLRLRWKTTMITPQYCAHCLSPLNGNFCPMCGQSANYPAPTHHLAAGSLLNNRYYVAKSLGAGGFGITYLGLDLNLNLKVAIKEFYPTGYVNRNNTVSANVDIEATGKTRDFVLKGCQQFMQEARALARFVNEPGIVGVRDYFQANSTAYIVMDYLEGSTLKDQLIQNGVLPADYVLQLLTPVMRSLDVIHQLGIIHRDISPDNIMLVGGVPKLLDFGAARDISHNKSLSVLLKEGYAPEEQYRSKGHQGPWTDVYALSATLYKCITGITPEAGVQRLYADELQAPSTLRRWFG